MTFTDARKQIAALGCTLAAKGPRVQVEKYATIAPRKFYRVAVKGPKVAAYITDSLPDAIEVARFMAAHKEVLTSRDEADPKKMEAESLLEMMSYNRVEIGDTIKEAIMELDEYADTMAMDYYRCPNATPAGLKELTLDYALGNRDQCPAYNKLARPDQVLAQDRWICNIQP